MSGPIVLALRLLLTLGLYTFLGWTVWTIWQDLKQTGLRVATRKIPAIRLEIRTRNREAIARSFSQPEVMLGRDPSCDLRLDDETVSARHAKLSYHHGQWWVEDLESTNGTKLNKEKLSIATVLAAGDEIKCGKVRVDVSLNGDLLSAHL
ncbi:MAG TPA: FHA domain-containing protein [Anaerolineales bacterium]|nr:FHA domain-containing protein [Anaerolineales bacterium]